MPWDDVQTMLESVAVGSGYVLEQLSEADVPLLIETLQAHYPEISVRMGHEHLNPAFYRAAVQLRETTADRDQLILLARTTEDSKPIVGMLSLEKQPLRRHLIGRLGFVLEAHRGTALGFLGPMLLERFARQMGAGVAWYFATLRSRHQQAIAERRGFQLIGIMPAADEVRGDGDGSGYWIPLALYAKVLVPMEHIRLPAQDALTAQTKKAWEVLLGTDLPL